MNYQTVGSDANSFSLVDQQSIPREIAGQRILTDAGINLFDVILPAGSQFAGYLTWSMLVFDGTEGQAFCGQAAITAINKAGAYTSQVVELAGIQSKSASAGTITEAVTVVNGTNKITIVVTPTGSLTETRYLFFYKLQNLSKQQVTVL